MSTQQNNGFRLRAIVLGIILSFCIGAGNVYNLMVLQGSYMALDFTTPAAIFFIFWLTLYNYFARKYFQKGSFSSPELILIYIMMIVSCSIPTMGLNLYLIPLIAGTKYYATPQNQWDNLILPHIKKWTVVQDSNAVRWFFEGIPKGESIPWKAWITPLFSWTLLILAVFLVMIFLMVILRKQWVESEKLNYPMTKTPLALIDANENGIFKNRVFWLGFLIPFTIGCINALHFYQPLFPGINLVTGVPIFRRTISLQFRISFPMIGFAYFINLPLAFSLWFFCLFNSFQQGVFNIMGYGIAEFLPYSQDRPLLGWQSFGALLVIVLYGFYISRKNLAGVVRKALKKEDALFDENEIVSYGIAFWGTIVSLLFIFAWLIISGLSPLPAVLFIFFAFVLFIGITRVVAEGGLAATRAPVISPVATTSLLGAERIGPSGLCALGLTFVYASDVRTFVMASVANGLKMLEDIKRNKRIIFWAIILSIVVTFFSSVWATLLLGYRYGAINANSWFFVGGPQYPWRYVAEKIKQPSGIDSIYIIFTGIGAVVAILLQVMHTRFLWFPFHPLGFAFSTIMMTNALWFSIFIAWLIKTMILRYGGAKVYEKGKFFFIGLIIGQFVVNGIWLIIDFFAGKTGNMLYWA